MAKADPGPALSVVIPTHNRCPSLLRTLDSLTRQTLACDAFEVVVALDATTDGSAEALAARDWPFRIVQAVPARRGAAANRNAGAAAARGGRLVFLDDDIVADPEFLAAHLAAALARPGAVVVGLSAPLVAGQSWFHRSLSDWWRDLFGDMQAPEHRFTYQDLTSGNFSIDRALFAEMGGFDEGFGTGAREDYELGIRLIRRGVAICHAAKARGLHHDASSLAKSLGRARSEGIGDVLILRRHPQMFRWVRVSHLAAPLPGARLFRVLAYDLPWAGRLIAALSGGVMPLLERLHLRGLWAKANLLARSLTYFDGVARVTGDRACLHEMAEAAAAVAAARPPRSLRCEAADGFAAMARAVDEAHPDEVRLYDGNRMIAFWPAVAAAEPLAARHLQSQAGAFDGRRRMAMAAQQLLPAFPRDTPVAVAGATVVPDRHWPIALGELDVRGWRLTMRDAAPAYPMRLMLRAGAEPLGWLYLFAPEGTGGFWGAVDAAIRTDAALLRRLVAALALPEAPPPDPTPAISVVICTRDRTETLRRCLGAVSQLDYPAHEIVVVDNAPSSEATRDLVAELPGVRYVREDRPGLDWARNCGIAAARHPVIAFTDDDTEADAHWLSGIARALADPDIAAVTGLVAPMKLETEAQVYFEDIYGGMGKGFDACVRDRDTLGARGTLWASGFGVGANMAFRRSALEAVGGFDPALDVGTATRGGGDIDMFHRIVAAGLKLAYAPAAFVWHEHRADGAALANQLRDNGSGFAAYLLAAARNRTVPRRAIAVFALKDWVYGWLVKRWWRPGRHSLPLIRAEVGGLLKGYGGYRQARRSASALARQDGQSDHA